MIKTRFIKKNVLEALKVSPVVFLNGARQAGKSTLVLNALSEIASHGKAIYITFDNATQMAAAASSPETFLSSYDNNLVSKTLSFPDKWWKGSWFFLEKQDGSLWAIEVKKSGAVSAKDFNGIKLFENLAGKDFKGGIVLYSGKDTVPFGKNLWAVPLSVLWQ